MDDNQSLELIVGGDSLAQIIQKMNRAIAQLSNNTGMHVISTRVRDPTKPNYGMFGESGDTAAVALEISPYTGAEEVSILVDGKEYAVNMSMDGANASNNTIIIKMEE